MNSIPNLIYTLFWVVPFLIERIADLLQLKRASEPLPENLQELQSPEEHQKSFNYANDRKRLEWFSAAVDLVFWTVFWKLGGFATVAGFSTEISPDASFRVAGIAFIAILLLLQSVLNLPFSLYSTFVIEARYGFNRTTWKTFVGDLLKGVLLSAIIGIPVILVAYGFLSLNLPLPFLWLWSAYLLFQIFLLWIAPVALLPLFLKLTPLPDGELKEKIESYRAKQTFKLNGVWVCDASKRSAKSNAFFTGFGKFRRLVLFDTLIAQQSPDEITAVVAHEAGHFRRGHIVKMMIISAITTLFTFWAVVALLDSPTLYRGFGLEDTNFFHFAFGLPLASIVVGKFMYPLRLFTTALSRKHEFEADRFAIETTGTGEVLGRALKKLSRENLSTIQYHPFYTALHLSHPPLPDRLRALGVPDSTSRT